MLVKIIKISIYLIFVSVLTLPLIQMLIPFEEVNPLKGAVTIAECPKLNKTSWFSSAFQSSFEKYINQNIGFRPWLVRLHNQIQYSTFNKASARGVIRGKEGYLFELSYINAYNGDDFIGSENISEKVKNIKLLQDKLYKSNITLLVCIAPGKGNFHANYFPDNLVKPITDSTNYKQYINFLKQENVNFIDMNKWFTELKDTCSCMLYPKYGIHWSYYGMLLATDSIIKYIEKSRNIVLPHIEVTEMERTSTLKYSDYDIGEGMNLIFQMKSEPMCYPLHKVSSDSNSTNPKTLVISDSYYYSMYNIIVGGNIFSMGGFWYYNYRVFPESHTTPLTVSQIDMRQRILDNDVIILMSTDANLSKFSWGFVDSANQALSHKTN